MQSERNCSTHAIGLSLYHVCAIARCGGGRDDDVIFCRTIAEAVFKVRRHMNALAGSEVYRVAGRVAPHLLNSTQDMDRLLVVMERARKGRDMSPID